MAAENGFLIAGKVYEVPTLDSLTLDEAELMYQLCELTQEEFAQEPGDTDEEHQARVTKLMRRPGFMASLAQIAYQRGNPTVKPNQVKLVLGKTNRLELFSTLTPDVEEEADGVPLASTSEPSGSSESGSPENESSTGGSPESGGDGSTNGSDGPGGEVVTIGGSRSGTSSISAPETLAASLPAT